MDQTKKYLENPKLQEFQKLVGSNENLVIEEVEEGAKALLIALAQRASEKPIVILTHSSALFDDLFYFLKKNPLEFPSWETLPQEEIPPSPDIVGERFHILKNLQNEKAFVILTTLPALLQKLIMPEKLQILHLKQGMEFLFEELPSLLSQMGYHKRVVAADKGEFAVRGGIVDVFPVSSIDPFRLEFFDEQILSIRKYDPISQTSVGKVDECVITLAQELEFLAHEENLCTFFEYLKEKPLLIFDDFAEIEDKYVQTKPPSSKSFMSLEEFFQKIEPFQKIYFSNSSLESISQVRVLERVKSPYAEGAPSSKVSFEAFGKELKALRFFAPFLPLLTSFCPPDKSLEDFSANDFLIGLENFAKQESLTLHFICQSESEEMKLKEFSLPATIERGYLSSGFYLTSPTFALIPMAELNHRYKVRRIKQRSAYTQTHVSESFSLLPGEAVVHMNSGIGRFLGIEKRPNHLGVETEYLLLEYAEGSKLYVPMEQANLISRYIGVTDQPPELHQLGSTRWKRSREKTESAIIGYAEDLLKLQAQRALKGGYAYPPDSELVEQFSKEFPYVETPDQLAAIEHVFKDMQSKRIMDRLICGDVGYGKTEVAMRAAFKAVVDGGKQVAILVPTTVLAMQHFETFSARMANFPVTIGILSRFCKPKEIKKTLEDVEKGVIDILIGTHRIISKDVKFKNLGLVIIDEEQRFGVKAKEHLKKIKHEVDCLTLSATPIPRTLYLSLTGARDLSVINTPPEDRLPIQSFVCHSNEELIKNALLRELARAGQAYVIHNRVETIYEMSDKIRTLLPQARIVVGHGQMDSQELDLVFHAFKSGNADILIATSIIENGIDIPNANTILIDRADRFGLADLYQMRGRVGRWNRKAYCYFLVPSTKELNEISRKRLSALTQSSGHGGGMKIALHDLEIRGAGNILGVEQSGHVAAIGFHLYCKLLKKTIAAMQKNEKPQFYHEVKIEFPYDARLPEEYVNETTLRMEIYQRLADADSNEEIDTIMNEIKDRFGPFPKPVEWLHRFSRIRLFATRNGFTLLALSKVVLSAEQSHGKKEKISKKILVKLPQTPEDLEKAILQTLKENFPIR